MMSRFIFKSYGMQSQQVGPDSLHPACLLCISKDVFRKLHLRFLGPVAPVVDRCGDTDHDGREEVTRHVVILLPRVFTFKDLHKHEVQLDPFKTHPGEGSQEEEVEDPRDDGTSNLRENNTDLDL